MMICKASRILWFGLLVAFIALPGRLPAESRDLLDIYRLALEQDPQLQSARFRQRASEEVQVQARALFLPQLNLEADAGRTWESSQIGSNPRNSTDFNSWSAGVALSQPLFRMESFSLARQADIVSSTAELELAQARQDLLLRASQAYFNVLLTQDQLDTIDAELTAIESELRRARRALEVGTGTITDVNDAQARYDRVQADRLRAQNDLTVARETLSRLIGEAAGPLVGLAENFAAEPPTPMERSVWAERAERYNLAVRLTEQNLAQARENISEEQAGRYPQVDLVARYGRTHQSDVGLTQPGLAGEVDRDQSSIGVNVSMPLYTGGATSSRIRERRSQRDAAFSDTLAAKRDAALQAESAYLNLTSNLRQIQALEQALSSIRSTEQSTQRGLEVGVRTTLDLLNVQRERFEVERQLAEARYGYLLNYLDLQVAVGGGVDGSSIEDVNFFLTREPETDSQ